MQEHAQSHKDNSSLKPMNGNLRLYMFSAPICSGATSKQNFLNLYDDFIFQYLLLLFFCMKSFSCSSFNSWRQQDRHTDASAASDFISAGAWCHCARLSTVFTSIKITCKWHQAVCGDNHTHAHTHANTHTAGWSVSCLFMRETGNYRSSFILCVTAFIPT